MKTGNALGLEWKEGGVDFTFKVLKKFRSPACRENYVEVKCEYDAGHMPGGA